MRVYSALLRENLRDKEIPMNDPNQKPIVGPEPAAPPAASGATSDPRGSIIAGSILVLLGAIFLAFNVLRIDLGRVWPIIFFFIGAGLCLPVLLMPKDRRNLAGLLIPSTFLFALGLIFFYNTLTDNWASWAYIWALIPASVGLGLMLAGRVGQWGGEVMRVGFWMFVISIAVCLILGAFFGGANAGALGAILLIALGLYLLIQSLRRSAAA